MSASEQATSQATGFETSMLTYSEFNEWLFDHRAPNTDELNKRICECIARTANGFITRERTRTGIRYQAITNTDARSKFACQILLRAYGTNGLPSAKAVKCSLFQYLINTETSPHLSHYDGLTLLTDDPHMLCEYVPPQGEPDLKLAENLIEFMRSRVRNTRAFDEEISSHAYRLRHPGAFIEKCFVHHCVHGNSGKSFLAGMLAKMYPRLANAGVQHSQLTEQFNGWAQDYLMIHVEELQGTEYVDRRFATTIKQMTTRNASSRKLYKDTVAGENHAIIGLNTNQSDLYGLATSNDEALLSRLVILLFNDPLTPEQWREEKRKLLICEDEPEYSANFKKIGTSLYHYLKDENGYKIVEGFNPSRYYEPEKQEVLKELRQTAGSVPERFINRLCKSGDKACSEEFPIITLYRDGRKKDSTPSRVTIRHKDLTEAWSAFMVNRKGSQAKYSFDKSVEPLLTRIGFTQKRESRGMIWVCDDIAKFNDWYDHRAKIETVEMKGYEAIGEDINAESDDDDDKCGNYVIQLTAARAEIERLKKDNIRLARAVDSLKAELEEATKELP